MARQSGFASLLFPHHYLTDPLQMPADRAADGLPAAGGKRHDDRRQYFAATVTQSVPVAEESATLDVLSEGNFVLGVGLGYREGEFDGFITRAIWCELDAL